MTKIERQRERRFEKILKGVCLDCTLLATPDSPYCKEHDKKRRDYNRKWSKEAYNKPNSKRKAYQLAYHRKERQ